MVQKGEKSSWVTDMNPPDLLLLSLCSILPHYHHGEKISRRLIYWGARCLFFFNQILTFLSTFNSPLIPSLINFSSPCELVAQTGVRYNVLIKKIVLALQGFAF